MVDCLKHDLQRHFWNIYAKFQHFFGILEYKAILASLYFVLFVIKIIGILLENLVFCLRIWFENLDKFITKQDTLDLKRAKS